MLKVQGNIRDYSPTEAERRLLAVLCNPDQQHLSVKKICEEADICRETYYSAMKKEGFREAMTEVNFRVIASYINPVIKQIFKDATDPQNKQRHQQQRMILEAAKMLGKDVVEGALGSGSSLTINIGKDNDSKDILNIGSAKN